MKISQVGVSILEILIGVTIIGVAGTILGGILTSSNSVFLDQTIQVNQGLSINNAAREITDLVKAANGAVAVYPTSGNPLYQSGESVLVLQLPAVSASGQVIDAVFDYAVVFKDSANSKILRMKVFPNVQSHRSAQDKVLSTSLKSIKFLYLNASNAQVSPSQAVRINFIINLSETVGFDENESSSSGTVNIKNY